MTMTVTVIFGVCTDVTSNAVTKHQSTSKIVNMSKHYIMAYNIMNAM